MRTILNYLGEANDCEAGGGVDQRAGLSDTQVGSGENTEDSIRLHGLGRYGNGLPLRRTNPDCTLISAF